MSDFTITLAKPVAKADGTQITKITFREPTGSDVFSLPDPVHNIVRPGIDPKNPMVGGGVEMVIDGPASKRWLVALCDCGEENMRMSASEARSAVQWLVKELNPDDAASADPKN